MARGRLGTHLRFASVGLLALAMTGCGSKSAENEDSPDAARNETGGAATPASAGAAAGRWGIDREAMRTALRARLGEQASPEMRAMLDQQVDSMLEKAKLELRLNPDKTAVLEWRNPLTSGAGTVTGSWTQTGATISLFDKPPGEEGAFEVMQATHAGASIEIMFPDAPFGVKLVKVAGGAAGG